MCTLFDKIVNKKATRNKLLCNSWYSMEMSDDFKNKPQVNKSLDEQCENEIGLLQTSPIVYGFRELPVDCPISVESNISLEQRKLLNLEENEFLLENNNLYMQPRELLVAESLDQVADFTTSFKQNIKQATPANRRIFVRNSSLSTISEEKTLATLTDISQDMARLPEIENVKSSALINSLLHEFQTKTLFLNEILHVFEPSSKGGTFTRNVPIRFSSPTKYSKNSSCSSPISPLSPSSTSYDSPSYFSPTKRASSEEEMFLSNVLTNEMSSFYENSFINLRSNKLMAKKIRFVKRLKNRIETKRGSALIKAKTKPQENLAIKRRDNLKISNSSCGYYSRKNYYNIKMRKFLSFNLESNSQRTDKNLTITQTIQYRENNENIQEEEEASGNILPKVEIKPVYF